MFFNKPNFPNKQTETAQNIYILGTSPSALFVAEQLQDLGHHISILCPPKIVDEFNATDFIFKDRRHLKSKRFQVNFEFEILTAPDILFIMSEPQNLHNDLLLLSHKKLEKTTIVNTSPTYPENFVSQILGLPTINAYFSAWLHRNKNHISLLTGTPSIKLAISPVSEQFKNMQNLLKKTGITLENSLSATDDFWQWLIPQAIIFFVSEAFEKNFYICSQKQDCRTTIEKCLKEAITIASLNNAKTEKNELLKTLYSAPENYISPWHAPLKTTQSLLLKTLTNMLFFNVSCDSKRFPTLKSLITKIENKL